MRLSYIVSIPKHLYYSFFKYRLYYTQCRHTYGVFLDSIPLLCLFSSVSSSDFSLRLVVFACSIIIGAISVMFSCSTFQKYNIYCNHHCMYSIYFI